MSRSRDVLLLSVEESSIDVLPAHSLMVNVVQVAFAMCYLAIESTAYKIS